MTPIRIIVSFRKGVLDPAAQAVERSLHELGFDGVHNLTLSKQIAFNLDEQDTESACRMVEEMCKRLLVNEVMETYKVTMQVRADKETRN